MDRNGDRDNVWLIPTCESISCLTIRCWRNDRNVRLSTGDELRNGFESGSLNVFKHRFREGLLGNALSKRFLSEPELDSMCKFFRKDIVCSALLHGSQLVKFATDCIGKRALNFCSGVFEVFVHLRLDTGSKIDWAEGGGTQPSWRAASAARASRMRLSKCHRATAPPIAYPPYNRSNQSNAAKTQETHSGISNPQLVKGELRRFTVVSNLLVEEVENR